MDEIRMIVKSDLDELKSVLDSIEMFPSEMLDDMISEFLKNPETQDIWFTQTENGKPVSIGYCAPEQLTEGTFNLRAIGVKSDIQGKGTGRMMITFIEDQLRHNWHRLLIVETSGTDDFQSTRKFYEDLSSTKEAVIRDFWNEGDDKVIYWKKLN